MPDMSKYYLKEPWISFTFDCDDAAHGAVQGDCECSLCYASDTVIECHPDDCKRIGKFVELLESQNAKTANVD